MRNDHGGGAGPPPTSCIGMIAPYETAETQLVIRNSVIRNSSDTPNDMRPELRPARIPMDLPHR